MGTSILVSDPPVTRDHPIWITSPSVHKQSPRTLDSAFLIVVVGSGGTLVDLLIVLAGNPTIQRVFQRVRFRGHQSGGPKQRMRPGGAQSVGKIGLADARQDDGVTPRGVLLAWETRELEVHESIMADVRHQTRGSAGGHRTRDAQRLSSCAGTKAHLFRVVPRGCGQEIGDRLPDAVALVGVRHQIDVRRTMLEDAALQNLRFGSLPLRDETPVRATSKESL